MLPLSSKVIDVIEIYFDEDVAPIVKEYLIYECADNIPMCENYSPEQMDRIRLSALKISEGDFKKLKQAVMQAKKDWRDLLMAAGFGNDVEAHKRWEP